MPNQKPTTSKLLDLKEWVTVPEAAKHLSVILNEEVTKADVLRLALDGRLKLSVNLVNGCRAKAGKVVSYSEVVWFPPNKYTLKEMKKMPEMFFDEEIETGTRMVSIKIDDERYLNLDFNEAVKIIHGIWDLPLIGYEKLENKRKYQEITNQELSYGTEKTLLGRRDGVIVESLNGEFYQLQQEENKKKEEKFFKEELAKLDLEIDNTEKEYFMKNSDNPYKLYKSLNKLTDLWSKRSSLKFNHKVKKRMLKDNVNPIANIPPNSFFVVRTKNLKDFAVSVGFKESISDTANIFPRDQLPAGLPPQSNEKKPLQPMRWISTNQIMELFDLTISELKDLGRDFTNHGGKSYEHWGAEIKHDIWNQGRVDIAFPDVKIKVSDIRDYITEHRPELATYVKQNRPKEAWFFKEQSPSNPNQSTADESFFVPEGTVWEQLNIRVKNFHYFEILYPGSDGHVNVEREKIGLTNKPWEFVLKLAAARGEYIPQGEEDRQKAPGHFKAIRAALKNLFPTIEGKPIADQNRHTGIYKSAFSISIDPEFTKGIDKATSDDERHSEIEDIFREEQEGYNDF